MLCAPVFLFTSDSSALLGRPRCGLSIWLSLLAIFNTLFWLYVNFFFHEKTDKTRKYSKSDILVWYENDHRRLQGAQSINTERACLQIFLHQEFNSAVEGRVVHQLWTHTSPLTYRIVLWHRPHMQNLIKINTTIFKWRLCSDEGLETSANILFTASAYPHWQPYVNTLYVLICATTLKA